MKPSEIECPTCDASPGRRCQPVDRDIEPGMTHLARSDAAARMAPKPAKPPDRKAVDRLYETCQKEWDAAKAKKTE